MIANAGIFISKAVVDCSMAEFDRMMSINCRGPALCFKYAGIQMIKQGRGGRILGGYFISALANRDDADVLKLHPQLLGRKVCALNLEPEVV